MTTYSYDALDRLAQATYPTSTVTYTLDSVGNRLGDGANTFTYNPSDRILNPGFVYDANGNLLSDGMATYEYDAANRLIRTTLNNVVTEYGYDGWGNLIQESVNGVTTEFVLDENAAYTRILGEVRSDGGERLYAYGAEGFSAQQAIGGGIEYPLLDGLGSVSQLTDADGTVILSRSYDAYGAVRLMAGTGSSRLGYTGELQDPVSGLVYLRARHYHPVVGRFLQRDSFGGFAKQPQSLNRYVYVGNNPMIFVDPSGYYADQVLLTHFGCESWSCVEANFQSGGTHAGLWGWLDVLLRAEDGDEISTYAFYAGAGALLTGRFTTQGGRIMVAGVTMLLNFSTCPLPSEVSDLWDEETFAKTALMGSWLPGHNAFYMGPYGVSVHNQQYQDCRHHDCVTQAIDTAGVAGAGLVVASPLCGPYAGVCFGAGRIVGSVATGTGVLWAGVQAFNGNLSPEDIYMTSVTTAVGIATDNPWLDLATNVAQWLWDSQ